MSWTTPPILNVGDILTAAEWNILANDLILLGESIGAIVDTTQSTTSTSFTDLGTVGPAVTLTTLTTCIVHLFSYFQNSTAGTYAQMGFAVSGATTVAASATQSLAFEAFTTNASDQYGGAFFVSGLTAGSNTFTAKYVAGGGGTATFAHRNIAVIPLSV